jgi:hypothetical protein
MPQPARSLCLKPLFLSTIERRSSASPLPAADVAVQALTTIRIHVFRIIR